MKNNLFWLLFGSTAVGLSMCGLALYFSILFAMAQDEVLDFAEDMQEARWEIEKNCATITKLDSLTICIAEHAEVYRSILQLSQNNPQREIEQLAVDSIGIVGDKHIYSYIDDHYQEEGFLAFMPLHIKAISENLWLTVQDDFSQFENIDQSIHQSNRENVSDDNDALDIALKGAIYGIFILLFSLALFLYFPVRRLNRWIADIQYASEQIAKQNYDVRLDKYNTQPLGHLASSFNLMAEKIQDHMRDKNVLANAIAHELRTPLMRFRLALALLARQPMNGMSKELLSDLERYTDDLETVTDNTLRLATLRDSKITLHHVCVHELLKNQQEKFQASFPTLIIDITTDDIKLETDVDFLQIALDNLISNACHYADGKIQIKQWYDNQYVYIQISDDGPGIPKKDVEYVQQAFTRLDNSRDRKTGGTGLGLAIVRLAVQRLQGKLVFQSVDQGTSIVLTIPLKQHV